MVTTNEFQSDVLKGFSNAQKSLPSKYLYDTRGSALFDRICTLPEYYPTRTEARILRDHLPEIASELRDGRALLELGSGSGEKAEILLRALPALETYVPLDISPAALSECTQRLAPLFPGLRVMPVCGDYTKTLPSPASIQTSHPLHTVFLGSTFGNFEPAEAGAFLSRLRSALSPRGKALVGVDLIKSQEILESAYDDSAGVTAAFNLNLLTRMNRELGASFDLSKFRHKAVFNPALGRVEMHLECRETHEVTIPPAQFRFRKGETIHTENSYKFDLARLAGLARESGLGISRVWTDARRYFAVVLFEKHHFLP